MAQKREIPDEKSSLVIILQKPFFLYCGSFAIWHIINLGCVAQRVGGRCEGRLLGGNRGMSCGIGCL